ncbi:hypothetical protein G6F35_013904 [Rhizopus arrhizus]|nr:hypothetical protein G6F35_013904 [Rhizopus arrhizus]
MQQGHAHGLVRAFVAAEQEEGGHAQRDGNDGGAVVAFVLVLMQRQPRPRLVLVDQAGVGRKAGKAGLGRRSLRQFQEGRRQVGPGQAGQRVDARIAVAVRIRRPAPLPAIGQRDRHGVAPRRLHAPEGRLRGDGVHALQQRVGKGQGKPAQHEGLRPACLAPALRGGVVAKQVQRCRHGHCASWKISPSVWRRPLRSALTPCRMAVLRQPRAPGTGRWFTVKISASPCCSGSTSAHCSRLLVSVITNSPPVKSWPGRDSSTATCSGNTCSPYRSWCRQL